MTTGLKCIYKKYSFRKFNKKIPKRLTESVRSRDSVPLSPSFSFDRIPGDPKKYSSVIAVTHVSLFLYIEVHLRRRSVLQRLMRAFLIVKQEVLAETLAGFEPILIVKEIDLLVFHGTP